MIRTLVDYGQIGASTDTEYPTGTEGWDSYPIPWGDVLVDDQQDRDYRMSVNVDDVGSLGG